MWESTGATRARGGSLIRYQCVGNAGHTVVNERGKFALHLLPSGIFCGGVVNVLGNGTAPFYPDKYQISISIPAKVWEHPDYAVNYNFREEKGTKSNGF